MCTIQENTISLDKNAITEKMCLCDLLKTVNYLYFDANKTVHAFHVWGQQIFAF